MTDEARRVMRAQHQLLAELGREPNENELATRLGVPTEEVVNMNRRLSGPDQSLNALDPTAKKYTPEQAAGAVVILRAGAAPGWASETAVVSSITPCATPT